MKLTRVRLLLACIQVRAVACEALNAGGVLMHKFPAVDNANITVLTISFCVRTTLERLARGASALNQQ
jgi:hypothetical protein